MAAARKRSVPYDRQVFLNCPFDDEYHPLLRAAVFTIHACGFTARIAWIIRARRAFASIDWCS